MVFPFRRPDWIVTGYIASLIAILVLLVMLFG